MEFNVKDMLSATVVLFAVIDIVGSIPLILDLKKKAGKIQAGKATLVSSLIMIAFLFVGENVIGIFGIDVESFAVAGSLVLFILAIEMILGISLFKHDQKSMKTASIVPLAFPIIAGAGSMTTIVSLRAEYDELSILCAIIINMALVFMVIKLTGPIERLLKEGGIAVLEKVFGIILLAIAVKLFSGNAKALISRVLSDICGSFAGF